MGNIHTVALAAVISVLSSGLALAESPRKVFVLHSYELGHVCGQPQHRGVEQALKDAGFRRADIKFGVYAMDTKRKYNSPAQIAAQARIALSKIREFAPDVLVTLDDNAFRTVALPLAGTGLPIVFSGMNNQPETYNQIKHWMESRRAPGHNITGVYEKIHFVTAVKAQRNILPKMKKIRIFSDNSPTGKALVRQIKLEIRQESLPVDHDFFITDSWEEYKRAVLSANRADVDTLYPVALRLRDQNGKTYTGAEILKWTATNSAKPSIPLNFAFVKLGLFGGAGVDFHAMGYQAGAMVAKILSGTPAGDIPIEDARRYALVFHYDRAVALGIKIPDEILMAADTVYRR